MLKHVKTLPFSLLAAISKASLGPFPAKKAEEYVSIRYDNTRFNGYIPGYHLSMPRALHRWDGRLYRRGLKICATSWQHCKRRDYRPELLGVQAPRAPECRSRGVDPIQYR